MQGEMGSCCGHLGWEQSGSFSGNLSGVGYRGSCCGNLVGREENAFEEIWIGVGGGVERMMLGDLGVEGGRKDLA